MLYNKEQEGIFRQVVNLLKLIEIDGESTQVLLNQIGQEEQMLNQLMMTMPMEMVNHYYDERLQYELSLGNDDVHPITKDYKHRFAMIKDDLSVIRNCIPQGLLSVPTDSNDELIQCFNNIEIACDLNSDESLSWDLYSNANKTIGEKLTDFYKAIAEEEEYFEYDSFQGTCHIQCSGSHISYNCTPFYDSSKGIPVEIVMNDDYKNFFVIECDEPTNDEELNKFKLFYLDIVQMFVRALN